MASNTPLIERADIHKSCKALESVVNVFNDYCQAAEALALTQKKLARALKDAVGLKATNELAGNALGAAAALLESLAEVDARFVKTVDKECEGASNDLKKWFKKLAKEERGHDERINAANAKIRNAGQAYEKKAKKKDRDAAEEHTRYVNLLSVVGPEMSQEKYNHSLFVTQRHTATLYSVTSSIARAADAEWARACDCVRRFAPVIGRIGESRAYLEGGWMANIPEGVEDKNLGPEEVGGGGQERERETPGKVVDEMGVRVAKDGSGSAETDSSAHRLTAPTYMSTPSYGSVTTPSSSSSHQLPYSPPSAPPSLPSRSRPAAAPPPTSYFPTPLEKFHTDSVRSIESLSSFPTPPTHFPLPAMAQLPSSPLTRTPPDSARSSEGEGERSIVNSSTETPYTNSPMKPSNSASQSLKTIVMPTEHITPALTDDDGRSPLTGQSQPSTPIASPMPDDVELEKRDTIKVKTMERPESPQQPRRRDSVPVSANEMGVQERKVSGSVQRTESVASSSSIVASMRDKWGRGDVPTTAPTRERDIPRVPNKVADLASRYTPTSDTNAAPLSPRNTGSPTFERARQFSSGSNTQRDDTPGPARAQTSPGGPPGPANAATTPSEVDLARRRRRIEELEDLERREQAQALRARERDIEMRTMELERERERLRTLGTASPSGSGAGAGVGVVRPRSQHSYSMTNLVAPLRGGEAPARPVSQYGEPLALSASLSGSSATSNPTSQSDHAPYCGCQTCSAAHYSTPPSHVQIVAQPRQEKEKSKGWMRRLSMPVVANAFSSDSKKSAYGMGAGIAGGGPIGYGSPLNGPAARFEQDSTGGISNVGHARPRKISFGRR